MDSIRQKLKRRLSHKDPEVNFDEHESADEDTVDYVNKEAEDAEKDNQDYGKPGSFLNKLILHGNKKTEDQLAREAAAHHATTTDRQTDRQTTRQ